MSVPVVQPGRRDLAPNVQHARRLAIASLLMVPALLLFYVAAYFAGSALQAALGLAEDEGLREAGVWGVVAGVFLIALMVVPQIVGVVLGVRARHLGERRLGTVGVAVNAAIAAYLLIVSVFGFEFA